MDYNKIVIESVNDLLNLLKKLQNKYQEEGKKIELFYRGQSNFNGFLLNPSIFRDRNFLNAEHTMFYDLKSVSPEEFDDHLTIFDQLTKMQHYGLPTRLLDITSNPLVALYFSCLNDLDKDGEFFVINNIEINYSNSLKAKILSNLVTFNKDKGTTLFDFKKHILSQNNLPNKINFKFIREILNSEVIIKPNLRNKRLKNQNGAFIIFGTKFNNSDLEENNDNKIKEIEITKEPYDIKDKIISEVGERYIIPSRKKKKILNELSNLGINKSSLFPELEKQADYIKGCYKAENQKQNNNYVKQIIEDNNYEIKFPVNNNYNKKILDMKKKRQLKNILKSYLKDNIGNKEFTKNKIEDFINEFLNIFEEFLFPDVFSKENILAKIKIYLKRLSKKYGLITYINNDLLFKYFIEESEKILFKNHQETRKR